MLSPPARWSASRVEYGMTVSRVNPSGRPLRAVTPTETAVRTVMPFFATALWRPTALRVAMPACMHAVSGVAAWAGAATRTLAPAAATKVAAAIRVRVDAMRGEVVLRDAPHRSACLECQHMTVVANLAGDGQCVGADADRRFDQHASHRCEGDRDIVHGRQPFALYLDRPADPWLVRNVLQEA